MLCRSCGAGFSPPRHERVCFECEADAKIIPIHGGPQRGFAIDFDDPPAGFHWCFTEGFDEKPPEPTD